MRCSPGLLEGLGETAGTTESGSQAEAPLDLFVRNALARVQLSKTRVDFGQEHEPLDRVVDCRVGREALKRFEDAIARGRRGHIRQTSRLDAYGSRWSDRSLGPAQRMAAKLRPRVILPRWGRPRPLVQLKPAAVSCSRLCDLIPTT